MLRIIYLLGLILLTANSDAQISFQEHEELGNVHWLRDYEEALVRSEKEQKPIFLLFQEVPGCATCRNYGNQVLSDPLIVDAIENEFVPLCIFNNVRGEDKTILDKYNEPSWNNPVVRIIKSNGKDVISRLSGAYTSESVILQMTLALKQFGIGAPQYLELYKNELTAGDTETAYYKMYCFWSGEAHLGNHDGVVATEPGWMGGSEVVKVTYATEEVKRKALDRYAQKKDYAPMKESTYRPDGDLQYYLKKSPFKYLALSPLQRTKINSELAAGGDGKQYLSPTQLKYLKEGSQKEMIYHLDLEKAWAKMVNQ